MKKIMGRSLLAMSMLMVLALPSQSYGLGWLAQWWNSLKTAPIADVEFSTGSTLNARLNDISIINQQAQTTQRLRFNNVSVGASVESQVLSFEQFQLTEGDYTVTVNIAPAPLVTDVLGSSFRTTATVSIESNAGTVQMSAIVRGRIVLRRGTYHLTALVIGSTTTQIAPGHKLVQVLSVPIQATATATTTTTAQN